VGVLLFVGVCLSGVGVSLCVLVCGCVFVWVYVFLCLSVCHLYNIFNELFSLTDKMYSSTTADITQLSEIPKSMGFLFLLQTFTQKQTCLVCLYIMSIQPQHYTP